MNELDFSLEIVTRKPLVKVKCPNCKLEMPLFVENYQIHEEKCIIETGTLSEKEIERFRKYRPFECGYCTDEFILGKNIYMHHLYVKHYEQLMKKMSK